MRIFAWVSLLAVAITLTAGPVLAAPVSLLAAPHLTTAAPHAAAGVATLLHLLAAAGVVFGITIRKDIGSIANKFSTRAQAATGDYKDGVQSAGPKWEQNTTAAEPAYEGGVQQAINNKSFSKGVSGQGSKYQTNAVNLGSSRYGPGVANAKDAYAKGMAPVISALQSISLPAKSFRGSPQNMARANAVATALAALRSNR